MCSLYGIVSFENEYNLSAELLSYMYGEGKKQTYISSFFGICNNCLNSSKHNKTTLTITNIENNLYTVAYNATAFSGIAQLITLAYLRQNDPLFFFKLPFSFCLYDEINNHFIISRHKGSTDPFFYSFSKKRLYFSNDKNFLLMSSAVEIQEVAPGKYVSFDISQKQPIIASLPF